MEIGPCTYFSLPPPSSWQMQRLQGMGSYLVSPASVTTTLSLLYSLLPRAKHANITLDCSHIKLLLKASHLCILVNSRECGNGCLQLMGKHTGVPTCHVVTEGIVDEYILILPGSTACEYIAQVRMSYGVYNMLNFNKVMQVTL